jgi:chromosome segregation ATPase
MNTTEELPPLNQEQKLDHLIDLVNSFRSSLMEQMNTVSEDSRQRYVDLRQRIDTVTERVDTNAASLKRLEEKVDRVDQRLSNIEIHVEDMDARLDAHIRDLVHVKARVRQIEDTKELQKA